MMTHSSKQSRGSSPRRAFLAMEAVAAVGLMLVALMLVAEIGTWSIVERSRNTARQQALEEAANALELARGRPWDDLTPDWAAAQRLPEGTTRLHDGKLTIRVEQESNRPRTKRVTAVVSWKHGSREETVELVALLSARTADMGGKP